MPSPLSHFDDAGASRMVDVGQKPTTLRSARARGRVRMQPDTWKMIRDRKVSKGDVIEVARLAGIMGAKRTGGLIPLCHPLSLDAIAIDFSFPEVGVVVIESQVSVRGKTGVEMEALVAVSTAALTVYDMCKSVDRAMVIDGIRVEEKTGGRSGHFVRSDVEEAD